MSAIARRWGCLRERNHIRRSGITWKATHLTVQSALLASVAPLVAEILGSYDHAIASRGQSLVAASTRGRVVAPRIGGQLISAGRCLFTGPTDEASATRREA
jgi:hypothetical protein